MKCVKNIFFFFIFTAIIQHIAATPINNPFEPVPIHTPMGTDKFYSPVEKCDVRFSLSPFYLHTASAKNGSRKKVPAGERLGQWNMFGLFYDLDSMASSSSYQTIVALDDLRLGLEPNHLTGGKYHGYNFVNDSPSAEPSSDTSDVTGSIVYPDATNPLFMVGDMATVIGSFSALPVDYEKIGMRIQASVNLGVGCGIMVKGGVVDCKASPKFLFDSSYMALVTGTPATTDTPAVEQDQSIKLVYDNLLSPTARNAVATAFGVDLSEYRKTGFEDTHVQAYWAYPFNLKDKEGDAALTMIPHLSVGVWLPTSPEVNVDKIFATPLGSNGFWSLTAEGALSFDFPQSIQISLGGGAVVSESKTVWQRMPNNIYQSGIYPWKTQVDKRPGTTWYANASFKAENFVDGLSCYFDYIFTQHAKDSLTLLDANSYRQALFQGALEKSVQESAWRSQQYSAGLNCKVTDMLSFGCAVQSHVTGVRVYRPTTILGSMTLTF